VADVTRGAGDSDVMVVGLDQSAFLKTTCAIRLVDIAQTRRIIPTARAPLDENVAGQKGVHERR
jgi:hypothetical protein